MSTPVQFYLDPKAKEQGCSFASPRDGDAGFDLYCSETVIIPAGGQVLVSTGLAVAIPNDWVGVIKDRSSMAIKRLRTHAGVIDAGYRGEVKIVMSNAGSESFTVEAGSKFAQMVVLPVRTSSTEVDSPELLGVTDRGAGGFGSTGS